MLAVAILLVVILAPKTVLTAPALRMLPNGKPDRLAMTAGLSALHRGK
jgi:O-succinylbenzoic acid--CoA ligase